MSIRLKKLERRNLRKTPPLVKVAACSRCGYEGVLRKDRRIHFREVHGFSCMRPR